jgi:hypothetical protein
MQVMLWVLVYLLLIMALARWRDHLDAKKTPKRRRADLARDGAATRRAWFGLRSVRDEVRHHHRTS